MQALSKLLFKIIEPDLKLNFIFYKMVDFSSKHDEYLIQCINTKAIFKQKLSDIILDIDILHGLHPLQACYIGLQSASCIEEICLKNINQKVQKNNFLKSRYGCYEIYYQMRNKNICFFDNKKNNEYVMDPRDICLSDHIISEFDASHAFYIGMRAAEKTTSRPVFRSHLVRIK